MEMTGGAVVVALVVLAASTRSVFATEYNVYGDAGCSDFWTYRCTYDSWATYLLLVGDILDFNFDPSQNSVAVVTESVFNTCENGISTLPTQFYRTSPTKLELLSPGYAYVVSLANSDSGILRCFQKLQFTVQSSTTTPSTPPPPPPDAPSSPTPSTRTPPPPPDAPSSPTPSTRKTPPPSDAVPSSPTPSTRTPPPPDAVPSSPTPSTRTPPPPDAVPSSTTPSTMTPPPPDVVPSSPTPSTMTPPPPEVVPSSTTPTPITKSPLASDSQPLKTTIIAAVSAALLGAALVAT